MLIYIYKKNIIKAIIIFFLILLIDRDLSAVEIKKIVLIGNSVDIEAENIFTGKTGNLSKEKIESIGARITEEYHKRGFTTCYVENLFVKENGLLEVHVKESRILGIRVSGVNDKEKKEIQNIILPDVEEVYNRFTLERRAGVVKRKYDLESISLVPVRFKDTGDVFLTVKAEEKTNGDFYGGIGVEPIYGVSPELGYYYNFDDSMLIMSGRAGYREGSFRKIEGDIKYHYFNKNFPSGLYGGIGAKRTKEIWMSRDTEYTPVSLYPVLGFRYIKSYLTADLYTMVKIMKIEDYNYKNEEINDLDTRLTLDLVVSNRHFKVNARDASSMKFSVTGGRSGFEEMGYAITIFRTRSAVPLFKYFRIIPRTNIYFTSSSERFFWNYIYDSSLLGFPNDYSASKWKNTAGLDIEYEIISDIFFAGLFVNTGLFNDEKLEWKNKTGGGLKTQIIYRKLSLDIYFAWDLLKGPADGGLYVLAGGRI